MRRASIGFIAASLACAMANIAYGDPSAVDAAIDRGLGFLVKDALAWKAEHQCASCHHGSLTVWALRESRQRGHAVDEPMLADLTRWVADSGDGRTGIPRPEGVPQALNAKAVHFSLALGAEPQADETARAGLARMSVTMCDDQTETGAWAAWPETRPPIFGPSDDSMTALATLALLPLASAGDPRAVAARDRAVRWMSDTPTDGDPQSVAMRFVVWCRLDRPAAERVALAQRIRGRQNEDGGWSQAAGMDSDAWATGQALYALAHAGAAPDDPAIAKAYALLVRTQRADGAWPMTSRPIKPGGPGSSSLIPITGAGAAWAVLGLSRSR